MRRAVFSLAPEEIHLLTVLGALAVVCLLVQRFFKPYLERDQYYYLKDITLIGAWALCGIWSQSPLLRATITAGVAAALLGFCQRVQKKWDLRPGFWLIGLGLALWGPRITFFGLPQGAFHYLSEIPSLLVSAFWIGLFPCLFQEIDEVPGLGGTLLASGWTLMLAVTLLASGGWNDAVFASLTGFVFILVFWSRHIHVYRRLGEPLAALWGTLMAGTAILGVTKGLTFSTLLVLPLGLFALPLLEASIHLLSTAFASRRTGNLVLYRLLINQGVDHPTAVHTVTALCTLLGLFVVSGQMGFSSVPFVLAGLLFLCVSSVVLWAFLFRRNPHPERRPRIWGAVVDNVSLHYALGKVRSWVGGGEPHRIFTVDALAALRSRSDEAYREAVGEADLVLPDGKGLIWAFRFLGTPIQERLPGVEFVEHLCRQASGEGWPVFFLGGKPGIAEKAARALGERHRDLVVAGCRDGYFRPSEEPEVLEAIRNSGARVLFLGLGVPRQELWLHLHARTAPGSPAALPGIVGMGIGGSMDVLSGELRRAPALWQRWGMEWLYRTLQEPWRWKRVIRLPLFVLLVLWTRLVGDSLAKAQEDSGSNRQGGF